MADKRVFGKGAQIIAIKTDVEAAAGDGTVFNGKNVGADHAGDGNTAAQDADKTQILHTFIFFDDLMGNPHQRTPDSGFIHNLGF